MARRLGRVGMIALIGCAGFAFPHRCQAQVQNSTTHASKLDREVVLKVKATEFVPLLRALRNQVGISIVADGTPLPKAIDLDYKGSLVGLLDVIADTFDYTWRTSSSGIVLLNKRFKNPEELPQIHPDELRRVASNIVRILGTFNSGSSRSWKDLEVDLAKTFTPEQTKTILNGSKLSASELSESQRLLLTNVIVGNYCADGYANWQHFSEMLDVRRRTYLRQAGSSDRSLAYGLVDGVTERSVSESIFIPMKPLNGGKK